MESWGVTCAAMAGLPKALLDRADRISAAYTLGRPIHLILDDDNRDQDRDLFKVRQADALLQRVLALDGQPDTFLFLKSYIEAKRDEF